MTINFEGKKIQSRNFLRKYKIEQIHISNFYFGKKKKEKEIEKRRWKRGVEKTYKGTIAEQTEE